jgi:uncharacterized RDD family membrane protein YckC
MQVTAPHVGNTEFEEPRGHAISAAGFLRRALASLIDNVLVVLALSLLLELFAKAIGDDDGYWTGFLIGYFFYLSIPLIAAYWGFTLAAWTWMGRGQSPGKKVMGIGVRDAASGQRVGLGRLLRRELFRGLLAVLLLLPLLVDGLSALWSEDGRTWHDRVAGTTVVRLRTP